MGRRERRGVEEDEDGGDSVCRLIRSEVEELRE